MNELETIKSILDNPDYQLGSDDSHAPSVIKLLELQKELKSFKSTKYEEREYQYAYEKEIYPRAYQPSKEEIEVAMCRYAMENEVWQLVYYLELYIKTLEGIEPKFPYTKESIEKSAQRGLSDWHEALESWDDNNEIWHTLVGKDWFEKVYVAGLSDIHSGDCTAFACSCARCGAEDMFKIPSTVKWGKGTGSMMFDAYCKDRKEKKEKNLDTGSASSSLALLQGLN